MADLPIRRFIARLPELRYLGTMLDAFFGRPGSVSPALREAIEARSAQLNGGMRSSQRESLPSSIQTYVDKVAVEAYKVLDEDFDRMKDAGYSEDFIYEVTLAATTGASLARLERGLGLLEEPGNE